MISGLKEKENTAPKHGGRANDVLPSARPWLGLKNPRIVRVPRAFAGKDRHSKVSTIRGLRDRRVRLSVQTALQLYDLQDKLGFKQPSKVVDWLISAAQHEIDKLPPLPFPPESFAHFCQQPPLPISEEKTSLNPEVMAPGNNLDALSASHRNAKSTAQDEAGNCHLALFSRMANNESLRNKVSQISKFPNFTLRTKLDHATGEGNSIRFADADYGTAEASANVSNASYYQLDSSNLNTYEHSNSSQSLSRVPASQLVLYTSGSGTPSMLPPFMTPLNGLHPLQINHIQGSDSVTFLQSSSPIMVRPSHPRLS